jgi:uncharacterized membrane protein
MDVFVGEWLNLLIRWAHLIVGIGWIGTSFYFGPGLFAVEGGQA